jgi:hypothetical protein
MINKIYTYKTISPDAFSITWNIADKRINNDAIIKQWKKNADIEGKVDLFDINAKEIETSITCKDTLTFYVICESLLSSGGTGIHSVVGQKNYIPTEDEFSIPFFICGEQEAGDIELTIYVALNKNVSSKSISLLATQKGSVLYENSIRLHLEGNQALFPVKAIDFSKENKIAPTALYYLKKKYSTLDSNFTASYLLNFNIKHSLFKTINDDTITEKDTEYIIKMIMYDVYRTIIYDALSNHGLQELNTTLLEDNQEHFKLEAVYTRIVSEMKNDYFPNSDLTYLKNLASGTDEDRNNLDTAIQSYILGE